MRRGLTDAEITAALGNLDTAALPPATLAALRLADRLSDVQPHIDAAFYGGLRQALDDDEILELGAALSIASGWQRFRAAAARRASERGRKPRRDTLGKSRERTRGDRGGPA
jgi:alkylhydroperoxidase family enzyme